MVSEPRYPSFVPTHPDCHPTLTRRLAVDARGSICPPPLPTGPNIRYHNGKGLSLPAMSTIYAYAHGSAGRAGSSSG